MHESIQGDNSSSWKGFKGFRNGQEQYSWCRFGRWINQNSKSYLTPQGILQWKITQQINQPWLSCCLWCCCPSCHSQWNWIITNWQFVTYRCHPSLSWYLNCRRCYDCFNSKKCNNPQQKISNFHNLCW